MKVLGEFAPRVFSKITRTYAHECGEIWNKQFSWELSLDLHWENKAEAKKVY